MEAGGEELVLSDIPFVYPALQLSPIDWQYKSEATDNYCLAMKEKKSNWPRGKVIGGSSVLNAMLYVRGNARDYDHWRRLGNPGKGIPLHSLVGRSPTILVRHETFLGFPPKRVGRNTDESPKSRVLNKPNAIIIV